jgi:hypothetical protein
MSGNKNDAIFRNLIKALFDEQRSFWNAERKQLWIPTQKALDIKKLIFDLEWKGIDEKKLEVLLQPDCIDFANKFILFLPPFERQHEANFVPAISISYTNGSKCFWIRSIMVTTTGRKPTLFPATCFRIEAPTSYCQDSPKRRHEFYHIQLLKNFGYGPRTETVDWLPETQPSIPIYAHEPIDALLCLILTLYGSAYYKDFVLRYEGKIKFMNSVSAEFKEFTKKVLSNL